ncbi:MAG: hypothetical protein ACKVOT_10700 [Polaromonas sp.]
MFASISAGFGSAADSDGAAAVQASTTKQPNNRPRSCQQPMGAFKESKKDGLLMNKALCQGLYCL